MDERILVFYKHKKDGMVTLPCKTLAEAKNKAKYYYEKGYIGVKVSKIQEEVLYIPSVDQ